MSGSRALYEDGGNADQRSLSHFSPMHLVFAASRTAFSAQVLVEATMAARLLRRTAKSL